MKLSPDIKAWLGLNLHDTILNLSILPLIFSLFTTDLISIVLLTIATCAISLAGLILHFKIRDPKVSKFTTVASKWINLFFVICLWIVSILRVIILIAIS